MSRAGARGIAAQGLGQGGRGEEGQTCGSTGVHGGGQSSWWCSTVVFVTLNLSPLREKKKANSAAANFAQLHLSTSNQPTGRKSLKKIDERFYLNALKGNASIHSDWPVTLSILWLKIIQTFKII